MKYLHALFLTILILAVITRIALAYTFPPPLKAGEHIAFHTTLLTEPTNYGNYQKVSVQYVSKWSSVAIGLILDPQSNWHYGQTIAISGIVEASKANPQQLLIYHPAVTLVPEKQSQLLAVSFYLRQNVQSIYATVLPAKSAGLLLGIVLGVKANFPRNFLSDLQSTGVMHVIAASGMNVTMVSGFLLGIFGLLLKRQWAIALTIVSLLFYCVLSGMQASILRATIMLVFALSAQLLGRQYSSVYGLLLAAGGMLLYNPTWITDVGFQLSFAATLGIFFLKPLLPPWGLFADDIGTTIAAQIATVPILVGSFGSYGILSIVVNALTLWTIPLLMVLGGIGALTGLIFAPLGYLLIWLSAPFLWYFETIVIFFGNFHWQVSVTSLPVPMILGYYLLLVSMVIVISKKR